MVNGIRLRLVAKATGFNRFFYITESAEYAVICLTIQGWE